MNEVGAILENLYRQFILRDLYAKIMPGFIVIISTARFFHFSIRKLVYLTSLLNFWQWLLLLAFVWITGFVAQHAGIMIGDLSDESHKFIKKVSDTHLNERFQRKYEIAHFGSQDFKNALERAIVIKEACGNSSVALLYAAGLMGISFWVNVLRMHGLVISIPSIISLLAALLMFTASRVLWLAHWYHAQREELFRSTFRIPPPREK